MGASIRTIDGIGPQVVEVGFEAADFDKIEKLRHFDCEDRKLWEVIQKLRTSCTKGL